MDTPLEDFASLGLIKDGMYKRIEFCIQNVFDICAILDTDLRLGIPHSDEDILEIMVANGIIISQQRMLYFAILN